MNVLAAASSHQKNGFNPARVDFPRLSKYSNSSLKLLKCQRG